MHKTYKRHNLQAPWQAYCNNYGKTTVVNTQYSNALLPENIFVKILDNKYMRFNELSHTRFL